MGVYELLKRLLKLGTLPEEIEQQPEEDVKQEIEEEFLKEKLDKRFLTS